MSSHLETQNALSTASSKASVSAGKLTATQWLVCAVAGVGFLFDTYEIVVQSIIVRPALMEIGTFKVGSPEFNSWVGWILYAPFLAGGIAGLVGGQLTDRFGRRRVLLWSIVLYGVATAAAAHARSPAELLLWRSLTIIGVSTEWIAATAWIAEMFPDRRRRDAALGFTQALTGVGVFLVAAVYYLSVTYGHLLPAIGGSHSGWRYSLMFGALPVVPVLIARLGMPESPGWMALKAAGGVRRPSFRELFRPELRRVTLVSAVLVASIYGIAFGVMQNMPRIVPGLPEVSSLPALQQEQTISFVHLMQDIGGLLGRFALAFLVITWLTRRRVLHLFQIPGMVAFPVLFAASPYLDLWVLAGGVLIAGILLNGQINFIGNYLPNVYPVHLRGTGESFAMSVGGRIVGTSTSLATPWLSNFAPGSSPSAKLALAAAGMALVACTLGLVVSRYLVEPTVRPDERGE
jgi:MFS family permease